MLKKNLYDKRYMLWYMFYFCAFGLIDQRHGSAPGAVQMTVTNCVGLVVALLLVPSLRREVFCNKVYLIWSGAAAVLGVALIAWGMGNWQYKGQWITGVLNVVFWGYIIIYIIREHHDLKIMERLRQPLFVFVSMVSMFLLMHLLGNRNFLLLLWMLLIFGGFYLIGIPKKRRTDFGAGILNGIIIWFLYSRRLPSAFVHLIIFDITAYMPERHKMDCFI